VLYGARIVKVTRKFAAVVIGATLGIGLLYLVTWLLSLFGADLVFLSQPTPLGIGLSIAICLVAALNLILDFAVIESGAQAGAPKEMEWLAAFGLVSDARVALPGDPPASGDRWPGTGSARPPVTLRC
jgi:uncharacterized YccA/Bax inhibitor family protein